MKSEKKTYLFHLFSGVAHGFALRCNLNDPYESKCLPKAINTSFQIADGWERVR
jgi:hypothetical protein